MSAFEPPARRGALLRADRGAVLASPFAADEGPADGAVVRVARSWPAWAFVAVLPLFGQSFQYVVDVLPAYALTKAWPLLTLPWAFWAFRAIAPPYRTILLFTCGWMLGVTPMIGIFELGNSIGGAVASTVKVWALVTGLSAAGMFVLLGADARRVSHAVIGLGVLTFAAMAVLFAVVPHSHYDQGEGATKLFLYDQERGYRIYMPMFFGMLFMFTLNRSFWLRPRLWKPLALGVCFALMLLIYKQRTPIAGTAVVIVIGAALSAKRWRWPLVGALALAGALAAVPLWTYAHSDSVQKSLGGSLTNRQAELAKGIEFLNAQPHRWVFGAGSATRVGDISLADIVGAQGFFLADLGWLGVTFEYGLIGVLLLVALHLAGLKVTWQAAQAPEPVARALFDYVLYVILASPILPVTFAPGEVMTCMALAVCFLRVQPGPAFDAVQAMPPPRRRFATAIG